MWTNLTEFSVLNTSLIWGKNSVPVFFGKFWLLSVPASRDVSPPYEVHHDWYVELSYLRCGMQDNNTVAMSNRVIDTGSRLRRRMENKGLSTEKGRLLLWYEIQRGEQVRRPLWSPVRRRLTNNSNAQSVHPFLSKEWRRFHKTGMPVMEQGCQCWPAGHTVPLKPVTLIGSEGWLVGQI